MTLDKQTKRKLARFYNDYADFIDPVLDATGRTWADLTPAQQKEMYKQHTGEDL